MAADGQHSVFSCGAYPHRMSDAVGLESQRERMIVAVEPPRIDRVPRRPRVGRVRCAFCGGFAQASELRERSYDERRLGRCGRSREQLCAMASDQPRIELAGCERVVRNQTLEE